MDIFGWLLVLIICALIAGGINSSKGRSYGEGFTIGLFLGFIGVIIVAMLPKNEKGLEQEKLQDGTSKKCPYCAEVIKMEANVCRYCGKELPVVIPTDDETQITKENLSKLTYRQKFAVTEYGYLLSPEDAEIVGKMLGSIVKEKDVLPFCKANGKKVISFEK